MNKKRSKITKNKYHITSYITRQTIPYPKQNVFENVQS